MNIDQAKTVTVFQDKTLEDLLKDIFERSTEDRNEAINTFREFKGMISDAEDLFMLGETPSKYLKIAQESTDNLIKMVNAVQKIIDTSSEKESPEESIDENSIIDIMDENGIGPKRFLKLIGEST